MKKLLLLAALLAHNVLSAQANLPPLLSNVQTELTGNNTLTVTYDLADAEGDAVTVTFRAAARGSQAFDYLTSNATGDVGSNVVPGNGKQIVWDFSTYATAQPDFRLMLIADDLQPVDIQSLVNQVDSARVFGDLVFLEGIRHRTAAPDHLQETKDFLWFHFLENELETTEQSFSYGNYGADNLIGRLIGTTDEQQVYVLGGHFDTVNDSPGADDNGSAVAGMLEAMRILSGQSFKKTIKFIGFDLEEVGLVGSEKYVQTGIPQGEETKGMIDFEMIGYYTGVPNSQQFPAGFEFLFPTAYGEAASDEFRGNFITNVGKVGNSAVLMNAYKSAAASYVPDLRVVNVEAPSNWLQLTPDLGRSDHAPFWEENIPAVMLTDGAEYRNDNYHEASDTLGTLNFTFLSNVVRVSVATLATLAEVQHADTWWTDTQFFTPTAEVGGCKLRISPNPARDMLKVEAESCTTGLASVALVSVAGQTVREATMDQTSSWSLDFDLKGIASGVYFLKVDLAGGSHTEKIVISKD